MSKQGARQSQRQRGTRGQGLGLGGGVAFGLWTLVATLVAVGVVCVGGVGGAQTGSSSFSVATSLYLPTTQLPADLDGPARLLSSVPRPGSDLVVGIMTANNLVTYTATPGETLIQAETSLPLSFGLAGPSFLAGNYWVILSLNFQSVAFVQIHQNNTLGTPAVVELQLSADLATIVDAAFDGVDVMYLGLSNKVVHSVRIKTPPGSGSVGIQRLAQSPELSDIGGFNTLVLNPYDGKQLFVGSKSGELVRVHTDTLQPDSAVLSVCQNVQIPVDAILFYAPFTYTPASATPQNTTVFVPCPGRDRRVTASTPLTDPADAQSPILNVLTSASVDASASASALLLHTAYPLVNASDISAVHSYLRSNTSAQGTLPVIQFTSARIDTAGGYIYIPFDMASDAYYQGCVARINFVNPAEPIVCLKLFNVYAEHFQSSSLSSVTSGTFGFYGAYPIARSTHQTGRIVQVTIPIPCTPACSSHGTCDSGVCICEDGFKGNSCELDIQQIAQKCADCTANPGADSCTEDGTCICKNGYKGALCQIDYCPNDCSGNGVCSSATQSCQCTGNYVGDACDEFFCTTINSCNSCDYSNCGWCESSGECLHGDISGPIGDSCKTWYYRACSTEILASLGVGYFITATFCILLVINMYSAWADDSVTDSHKGHVRKSWWRSQRSAKAWVLMELMQFSAITGVIGFSFSSSYVVYTKAFAWANFWGEDIFNNSNSGVSSNSRTAQNKDLNQYTSEISNSPEYFFATNLFYVALLTFIWIFVMKVIGFVRDHFTKGGRGDPWVHVHGRFYYVIIRVLLMAAPGLCVSGGAQIYYTFTDGGSGLDYLLLALAILVLLFIYGGLTGLIIYFKKASLKEVMSGQFRKKFGCLFEQCHIRKTWYYSFSKLSRLAGYFFVGLLQKSPETAVAIMIGIRFVYLLQLLFLKPRPYLDPVQFFLDAIRTFLEILTLGLLYLFRSSTFDKNMRLATGLVILLQFLVVVVCIVTYIMTWVQGMLNIQSWGQFVEFVKNGFKTEEQRGAKSHAMESLEAEKRVANP